MTGLETNWPLFILITLIGAGLGALLVWTWTTRKIADLRREQETHRDLFNKEAKLAAEREYQDKELKLRERFEAREREADALHRSKRQDLQKDEERLAQREELLEKKLALVDAKEIELSKRERQARDETTRAEKQIQEYRHLVDQAKSRLEQIARYTEDQARRELIATVEAEAKAEGARLAKRIEDEAKLEAERKAKRLITIALQRYAGEHVAERSVSTVQLPSDAMKGRIIGREGRNIRTLEQKTGIDIVIDDTPEVVILSGFNPIRREIAKVSLERLIADGRIHPPRIEEVVDTVTAEMEKHLLELGKKAAFDLGLHGIHPEILRLVGALNYRTSYSQNQYLHAQEVAYIAGIIASELKLDSKIARRGGLLHDIGKAMDHEIEGSHAIIGAEFAKKHGEPKDVWHAIGAHHEDWPHETFYDTIVQAADSISGARPGARREALDMYIKRLEDLERISTSFEGVEKAFAIQAGREVRVMVASERVSDDRAAGISRDIARKIESEMVFPGEIRVTVIRETRAVDVAR